MSAVLERSNTINEKKVNDALVADLTNQLESAKKQGKYLDEKVALLTQIIELKAKKAVITDHFEAFWKARVRIDTATDEQTSSSDLYRAYKYWFGQDGVEGKTLSKEAFIQKVEAKYTHSIRPLFKDILLYNGMFVFNTEEDVIEYDAQKVLDAQNSQA